MSISGLDQNEMSISKFYEKKSVFITGCSGFLGSVILETLLRCVPGIGTVYILLRGKRGESPETRLKSVYNKPIFKHLKNTQPEVFGKVQMVPGDLEVPALGLSESDREMLIQNVSIVFHCAASLNFNKPLKFMLAHNVLGTKYMLDLCKEMEKLEAMIHTSTIACNPHIPKLKEQVYKMPVTASRILDVIEKEDDAALEQLLSKFINKWPNYYTFSKNVAENLVRECYGTIPTAIIRTSLIGPCWKGILPGYVETSSGLFTFGYAIGKGYIRVIRCDPEVNIPVIPADISANTHIVVACGLATQKLPSFLVVNCTRDEEDTNFKAFVDELYRLVKYHPLPKAFLDPSIALCNNKASYWAYSMFEHYVPAIIVDSLLFLSGNKPRMYKGYQLYDKAFNLFSFFFFNQLKVDTKVFRSIREKHEVPDKELFYLDIEKFKIRDAFDALPSGSEQFDWSRDKLTKKQRRATVLKHTIFMRSIKVLEIIFLMYLIWQIMNLLIGLAL